MRRMMMTLLLLVPAAAFAQSGRLHIDLPASIAAKASETVDVNLDGVMLRLAAKFLSDDDEPGIREMVRKLEGIYVRSYEFDEPNVYDRNIITGLRAQLGPEWKRIVTVESRSKESSEIYVRAVGDAVTGLVVLCAEPRELTIVNIVGPIDLEKLASLEGNFGIPRMSKGGRHD
jgi:uncharacterized protein DUF4252